MSVDSVPVFEDRVRAPGLEAHLERFRALGWTTLASLGFASDYVPGQSDAAVFTSDIVVPVLREADHVDRFRLRRLYVEAFSLAASEIRRRCETGEDDTPRRLPLLEREDRRRRLAERLVGVRVEGDLEPSHALQDLAYALYDGNVVKYVPWEACTKRAAELQGAKTDKTWRVDSNGFLKESVVSDVPCADIKSDLLLLCALRRRALAFDMADVASYETMEEVTSALLAEYLSTPPPGYARVSLEQLRRADMEVFRQLSDRCRQGVRRAPDGLRPFDAHIPTILASPAFRYLLMPLPGRGGVSGSSDEGTAGAGKRSLERTVQELRAENKRLRAAAGSAGSASYTPSPSGGKGKGAGRKGGKSQGKGKFRGPNMPPVLVGKAWQTAAGDPICFKFNMPEGCNQASPGGRCSRGLHVCAEPGCGKSHSILNHSE